MSEHRARVLIRAGLLLVLVAFACASAWPQAAKSDPTCSPGNLQQVQPELVQEVDHFLHQLQAAVESNDRDAAAQLFKYPFAVHLKSGGFTVRTPADFVKKYDRIFPRRLVSLVENQRTQCINQVGARGFMLGQGEIWFDELGDGNMQAFAVNLIFY